MALSDCKIIELPRIPDQRGNLTFVEGSRHVPFDIKRVYYLYDVPGGATRAAHGHRVLHQLMIAMSGSFDVTLNDGRNKQVFHLNRSYNALYTIRKMTISAITRIFCAPRSSRPHEGPVS